MIALYDYSLFAQHPKLLALYSGWIGQKICFLTHSAVTWDRSDIWSAAAAEVDRLVVILHHAEKTKVLKLSGETGAALSELIGYYAAGGWWTSKDGTQERMTCQQKRREQDKFPDHELDPDDTPFQPRLLLECDSEYPLAATAINQLDAVLMQTAVAMDNLDECRLGVSLAGFCYRSAPKLGVPFINSVLNNLAARDLTDLQAENEFRRAVSLPEISEDRLPRSIVDPAPAPPLLTLDDVTAGSGGNSSFEPYVGDMTDQRDLMLACVFCHFDVPVPPAEGDASQYPELADLIKTFRTASAEAKRVRGKTKLTEETRFWTEEAIAYLGLDRCGLARPDLALQRLIKKRVLRPVRIGRRNAFTKAELDRILAKGGQARRRGRPGKDKK